MPTFQKIPFDYEVVSVSETQALLKAEKGEATLPNNPKVKVFRGIPPNQTEVAFSTLAPGQKLQVERIPGQEVRVYIIE